MPRLSDPLLARVRDLRSGLYASVMTPQELSSFEQDLATHIQNRISILDGILVSLSAQLKALPKDAPINLLIKLVNTIARVVNKANYLQRSYHYISQRQQTPDNVNQSLLLLEAEDPLDALPEHDPYRSSIKTEKISSKFPPRQAAMDLTDEQWQLLEPLLPRKQVVTPGRPPQSMREVLNAILWKLRTNAPWDSLPGEYPCHQTCYRYYSAWSKEGRFHKIVRALLDDLRTRGGLDLLTALELRSIEIVLVGRKHHIRFAPYLQDTWKSSTALAILQYALRNVESPTESKTRLIQIVQSDDSTSGLRKILALHPASQTRKQEYDS